MDAILCLRQDVNGFHCNPSVLFTASTDSNLFHKIVYPVEASKGRTWHARWNGFYILPLCIHLVKPTEGVCKKRTQNLGCNRTNCLSFTFKGTNQICYS